jgi:hypothetical protein
MCACHPWPDVMIRRLEGRHHDCHRGVGGAGIEGLSRVEDAAIRRIEPGLRDGAHLPQLP